MLSAPQISRSIHKLNSVSTCIALGPHPIASLICCNRLQRWQSDMLGDIKGSQAFSAFSLVTSSNLQECDGARCSENNGTLGLRKPGHRD